MMFYLLVMLVGCGGSGGETTVPGTDTTGPPTTEPTTDTTDTTPTETGVTEPTGSTGDTATTPTTGVIDCANLPAPPFTVSIVPDARGYHGIVFTDDGSVIGADGTSNNASLIEADAYGWSVYRPNIGYTEQLDRLDDGSIVAIKGGDVIKVTTLGEVTVLNSVSGGGYGIRVGPDGMVYTLNQNKIERINPNTGTKTEWLNPNWNPKVMDFSVDGTKAYVGTNGNQGKVYMIELDGAYNPVAAPVEYARTPGSWHDGLTVDVCGNLYVAVYDTSGMYRVSTAGNVQEIYSLPWSKQEYYGHGAVFGRGFGDFDIDVLYAPNPYNGQTVSKIEVGVPHKSYTGPVINGP